MPPAKSRYSRPSTSQMRAPSARATTRAGVETPRGTYRARAARTSALPTCSGARMGAILRPREQRTAESGRSVVETVSGTVRKREPAVEAREPGESIARRAMIVTAVAVGVVVFALALWKLRLIVTLLFVGITWAAAMRPGVDWLRRH